jgi:hypothetical protein
MPNQSLSQELRPHMIAGVFWYLVGLITLAGLHSTYDYLRIQLGGKTAIVIDLLAIVIIFFVLLTLIRWWIGPKKTPAMLRKVQVHREDGEHLDYKWKVRIAIKNETDHPMHVRNPLWIANGEVPLELPPKLKMQIEKVQDGWRTNQWLPDESSELQVPPKRTFRTWIGLHEKLSERDFGRFQQNEQFGTLLLTVDGDDLRIPV